MTTPTEHEALIDELRESDSSTEFVNCISDKTRPTMAWRAAEMLAADAQEIELLKEKVAYEQALGDKHFAAHTRLQAELDGIRGQEAVANVTVSKWRGLGNVEWQEQVELPDGTHMLYLAAGAQQVAVPQGWADAVNIARNLHRYPKEDSITPHGIRMLIAAILGADEVFTAAPQPPQAERVPMTEEELEDGFNSPSVDVAPTDTVESVFAEGARFAERHHGIGAKP